MLRRTWMVLGRKNALTVSFLFAVTSLAAGEMRSTVGRVSSAPVIDGVRDPVYSESMPLGGFTFRGTMQFAWAWTEIRFVRDDRFLYGFASCCQRDAGRLVEGKADEGNCLELYFITDEGLAEYDFGPSGSVRLAMGRQDEANQWIVDRHPARTVKSAVALGPDDTWCVEFAIPLSELPGRGWAFNARRIRPGQMESFWQRQDPGSCWNPAAEFGRLAVVSKPLGDLAFGEFPRFPEKGRFEKSVTNAAGRIVYNYFYEYPRAKFVRISPANLDRGTLWLDGGLGLVSRLTWKSRHNYPVDAKTDGLRVNVPLRIRFKVPRGVVVEEAEKVKSGTDPAGGAFDIYEQASPYSYGLDHYLKTRFTCTLPKGTTGVISYATRFPDGGERERTIPFAVTAVRETCPPKRFSVGFYHLFLGGAEEARQWSRIGLNTFTVRGFGENAKETAKGLLSAGYLVRRSDYFWPGAEPGQGDVFNEWGKADPAACALDIDGKPIRNGRGFQLSPSYRGKLLDEAVAKEAAFLRETGVSWCAFDIEGYAQRYGEKGDFRPETVAAFKRKWAAVHPDLEAPEPTAFERDPKSHPEEHRIWVDVKCELWGGMIARMKDALCAGAGHPITFSEWSMNTIEDLEARNHSLRGPDFFRAFDLIELDAYSAVDRDLRQIAFKVRAYRREFPGVPLDIIITPAPHRLGLADGPGTHYWTTAPAVPDENLCIFKEALTLGAKGVYGFHFNEADVNTFRQVAEGARLAAKVEDIVLDGTPFALTSDFPADARITDNFFGKSATWENESRVFTRGISHGKRMLVSVSEYREQKPVTVRVNLPLTAKMRAVDLETDEPLGEFGPERNVLPVTLPPERRCRLVLLEEAE